MGSIALFVFGKNVFASIGAALQGKRRNAVIKLSSYSFGVYLIHPLVINIFHRAVGLSATSYPAIWWVPVFTFMIFVASAGVAAVIAKVPYVRNVI